MRCSTGLITDDGGGGGVGGGFAVLPPLASFELPEFPTLHPSTTVLCVFLVRRLLFGKFKIAFHRHHVSIVGA